MTKVRKTILIFLLAFALNAVWENLHSLLYQSYMGGAITEFILLRAAFTDATIITVLTFPFLHFDFLKKRNWLIIPAGIIISIAIEKYALATGRWTYNEYMPIIPFLSVGLTPIVQLGFLGFLSYKLAIPKKET